MKKIGFVLVCILLFSIAGNAQFKSQAEQPSVSRSLVQSRTSMTSFFGLLNPDNIRMQHNFSMSYFSFNGTGMSLASYTNSLFYKISDPLNVRFDVTLQGSPFGQSAYQDPLNGVFLSRAELNYRPWENFLIRLEYNRLPLNYYGMYNPWYNPFSTRNFRDDE
jgi:hypothetical protein